MYIRAGWPHQPLSGTLDDQLPSMSGAHGLKDFFCRVHLLESFEGRIYSLEHFHKCKFVPQRTQEDEHYRENLSNHELLTLRGVDRRVCLIRVCGVIPPYSTLHFSDVRVFWTFDWRLSKAMQKRNIDVDKILPLWVMTTLKCMKVGF